MRSTPVRQAQAVLVDQKMSVPFLREPGGKVPGDGQMLAQAALRGQVSLDAIFRAPLQTTAAVCLIPTARWPASS